jgi:HEAT repeat protein
MDPADVLADPLAALDAAEPADRRLALSLLAGRVGEDDVRAAVTRALRGDPEPVVRAEAVEILGAAGAVALDTVVSALGDPDTRVVEAAVTALGEIEAPEPVPWLIDAVASHPDKLVQEAAVAALGAIGDARAIAPLLEALASGSPQVRRRAVVALTVFDDPAIEPALRTATDDRNPMVREVAEMVVGRPPDKGWQPIDLAPRPREDPPPGP